MITPAHFSIEDIASGLPDYNADDQPASQVSAFLARWVHPVSAIQEVPLLEALGRVVAKDIVSPVNVPPHDNAAMDGYAFASATQLPAPVGSSLRLRIAGTALAGAAWRGATLAGECVKITTGAVMPAGLDTVVPQELVQATDDGHISFAANAVRPGANRRRCGEDLSLGGVALAQGTRISPAALGLLASLGLAQVSVYRKLRVAYFSTGDEILAPGQAPREGAVYDSNRFSLFGLLTRLGVEWLDLGAVADEPTALEAHLRRAAQQADVVITSGGVSVGEADHTRATMQKLGEVVFWRVAMRPGRPMAVGRIRGSQEKWASNADQASTESYQNNKQPSLIARSGTGAGGAVLFGLPGNPVAAMVSFIAFVRPALLRMMGSSEAPPPRLRARSTQALRKAPGRTEYQRGVVDIAPDGALQVRTTGHQGSGLLSSMVLANGLIVLPHDQGPVAAGDWVEVMLFEGAI
ncbi:molybdopterin molybdotransferase MoeA [Variovorax sp. HJSM1_2]|uniref:molybdopterin molybdotransferase MoeA n=1 Tax=Variovorax sp. HJSM1_2 TaxID=3366263 RepID=UPI003BC5C532